MLWVEITDTGRRTAETFRRIVHQHQNRWLSVLSSSEQRKLIQALHRLQASLPIADAPCPAGPVATAQRGLNAGKRPGAHGPRTRRCNGSLSGCRRFNAVSHAGILLAILQSVAASLRAFIFSLDRRAGVFSARAECRPHRSRRPVRSSVGSSRRPAPRRMTGPSCTS
jgi:hypothetical protein